MALNALKRSRLYLGRNEIIEKFKKLLIEQFVMPRQQREPLHQCQDSTVSSALESTSGLRHIKLAQTSVFTDCLFDLSALCASFAFCK